MTFELAKNLSFIIHMTLILFFAGWVLLYNIRAGAIFFLYKTYFLLFTWFLLCYLFNGCPLTHLENWVSLNIYGKEFYESYTFNQSMAYDFMRDITNFVPLITVLTYKTLIHLWESRIESRKNWG